MRLARGGRGSASSLAQRRSGGREFAKVQTLSAIDVSGLVLPHHHTRFFAGAQ